MFDSRSLFFVGAVTCLICMVMLFSMRHVHRRMLSTMLWGTATQACLGAAMLLMALGGLINPFLSVVLSSALGAASAVLILESMRRYFDLRPTPVLTFTLFVGCFIVQMFWSDPNADVANRIIFTSLCHAVAAALSLPYYRKLSPSTPRIPARWGLALTLFYGLAHLGRVVWTLQSGATLDTQHELTGNPLLVVFPMLFALAPMVYAMVLVALVNGQVVSEYRKLASIDTLTGLRGRRAFFEDGARLLNDNFRASRMTALLMLDLDHFKRINDKYGHPAGDKALVAFAHMLRMMVPEKAVPGRYGGEEFCLISPVADRQAAMALAEDIVARTRELVIEYEAEQIALTVSIGLALSPDDGLNINDLVPTADKRVYLAKACGRDTAIASDRIPDKRASRKEAPPQDLVPV
ncbi:MAG: GGDEF domain-containing protein [Burkholderiaceae bacterium]